MVRNSNLGLFSIDVMESQNSRKHCAILIMPFVSVVTGIILLC